MGVKNLSKVSVATLFAVAGLATFSHADNPISSYHYLADPSAASDGDTFYILTDTDDMCNQNSYDYDLIGLYAFTSKDMKNWTDHGLIFKAKREFDYVGNTWASGIAVKNGRIYIVYPDATAGVGMITATSIDGPYTDPIANNYGGSINKIAGDQWRAGNSVLNGCDGIAHCFDPGIFFDDDGTGYVIFGGGENSNRPYGNNLDMVKFTSDGDKVTIDKNSLTRIVAENSFEAPYIHKYKGKYYVSFNTPRQAIDYGISDSPMGPYSFVGEVIPGIGSVPDAGGRGGNNHQGFAEFQGKWYAVYHDRRLAVASEHPRSCTKDGVCSADPNPDNHRSVSIDEITWNGNEMVPLTFTREGPSQIIDFDPYQPYKALTSSKQRNVRSRTDWTRGQPVTHVLTPLASKESWIRVSGVNFGTDGAKTFRITGASVADGNKVEIHKGSVTDGLAGTCDIKKTGNWTSYAENECEVSGLTGLVDELFIVFKGNADSTMGLIEWSFTCNGDNCKAAEPQKQTPFGGTAWVVPGKIEAENFDIPGDGYANTSYSDNDSEDRGAESNGGTSYREGTGVDIYKKATGYAIGYNEAGEWLEYTIDVKEAGDYTMFASVATNNENASFSLSLDDKVLAEFSSFSTTDFDIFDTIQANVTISSAGQHVLRMDVTSSWFDVDFFAFVKGKDASTNDIVEALPKAIKLATSSPTTYDVFNLKGKKIASFNAHSMSDAMALWNSSSVKGYEKASGMCLIRNRSNGMVAKVRVIR